ncbi:hypothetical protein AB0I10_27975 [Streptomyces sp. NPDC050636]|uniref:hypothetical protein n=1 Tax=Streptomyces sp. NPDC050636 TaxID=3154510 RepID=UPI003425337E
MKLRNAGRGAVLAMLACAMLSGTVSASPSTAAASAALPACPKVFGHGGYPTGDAPWERDQVRQLNNPRALAQQKSWGADGVEGDLQLTMNGTKGVMWHNSTTNGLSGTRKAITEISWAGGADKLQGRKISRGPYKGETVYTFREWLDRLKALKLVAFVELKGEAKQSLLHSDAAVRDRAWREVLDPIRERMAAQEIKIYTRDDRLRPELDRRINAAGLEATLRNHPKWVDGIGWEEPPPAASGNYQRWQSTLAQGPRRIGTSWTKDYKAWLKGRCA